ncbi:MAG: hypothetical protein ACYS1A_19465 [Planctomycetota bacterium]|jgi:DNA-binding MarR family transcriptional regulator
MSKGLGKTQKAILDYLENHHECKNNKESLAGLVWAIQYYKIREYKNDNTAYASVSRAVSQLEKLGRVKKYRDFDQGATEFDNVFGCVFVELVKR